MLRHPGVEDNRTGNNRTGNNRAENNRAENNRARGASDFFILSQDQADHFVLRPWDPGGSGESCLGAYQEIRPVEPVPAAVHRVIAEGMPVPRDGALLGWVSDRQATVLFSVYHGQPGGAALPQGSAGPQIRALPMVGSDPLHWPEFTVSPLDDGRLWEYIDRGELVDLAPVVARAPGKTFWVPSQNTHRASQGHGCVVIRRNLSADDFWLPIGVYMDHWMLREGVPAPPAGHLLGLSGTTDLAHWPALAARV